MSKSDDNDASRINLLDRPEIIRQKIKRCKTDPYTSRSPTTTYLP